MNEKKDILQKFSTGSFWFCTQHAKICVHNQLFLSNNIWLLSNQDIYKCSSVCLSRAKYPTFQAKYPLVNIMILSISKKISGNGWFIWDLLLVKLCEYLLGWFKAIFQAAGNNDNKLDLFNKFLLFFYLIILWK